jgi:DNA helicase II / ATP-dependent DNA helicase PcrA
MDAASAVLDALDPEQREVALATRGPVCVLAGAGTGKTRAVAHRIAYAVATGVADPAHVLAVTFTTRAAGELRGRLRQLGSQAVPGAGLERTQARTFHAAALRQLTHFWPVTVGGPPPQILDSKAGVVADAARRLRLNLGSAELRDVAGEIEWAKVTGVRPEDYPSAAEKAGRTTAPGPAATSGLYAAYQELCRERHVIDFESVLELTAAILAEHPEVAAAVRDQYRHFVIDEYQDVNPLQKLVLDAWVGDRDEVCVVGDPRQTIYSFAGASPAYLTGFTAEYPGATVIKLVRSYRSTPQVVALANRLGGALVAQRPGGPEPEFTEYASEQEEAAGVARRAAALVASGTMAGEIAVLVRANAQTLLFEQALTSAGVPFTMRGAERFFDRAEVRQAIGLLRAAARSVSADEEPARQVRAVLSGIGLTSDPPSGRGRARERWESLAAVAQFASDFFTASPEASLASLAGELTARGVSGEAPVVAGVTLASLHASKGLEWDVVFLAGLTDGMLPIIYASTADAISEERRLLYVGLTRARDRLCLSWAASRSADGPRARRPSRFIEEIRPRARRTAAGRPSARDATGTAAERRSARDGTGTPAERRSARGGTSTAHTSGGAT